MTKATEVSEETTLLSGHTLIHSRKNLLFTSLCRFYDNPENMNTFLDVVQGETKVSLRLLDWLITNYSKNNNVCYIVNDANFNIYLNYKTQLKAYSKKQFDPFQRRERICFEVTYNDKKQQLVTTIGQLNFFRWAIQHKLIEYAMDNITEIENDMNRNICSRRNDKKTSRKKITTIISNRSDVITFNQ